MSNTEELINDNQFRGYSRSEVHSTYYTWEINEITTLVEFAKALKDQDTAINSPEFSTGSQIADPWYLKLAVHPSNYENLNLCKISVTLLRKNFGRPLRIKYKLFLLNDKKEKVQGIFGDKQKLSTSWTKQILVIQNCHQILQIFSEKLFERRQQFLQNDVLTIGVELVVYDDYVSVNNKIISSEEIPKSLSDDLKNVLLGSKNLESDVIVKVNGMKFEAHKFMLIARSSVFEAMFSHNLEESRKNEIDIPDVEPLVFEKLLEFIYTDKVEDLNGCAEKLLEAADKYDLQGLKKICQNFTSRNITSKNAIAVMVSAYLHNDKQLMELAMEFIARNSGKFKSTQEFKALKKSHQFLYFGVLEKSFDFDKGPEDFQSTQNVDPQ